MSKRNGAIDFLKFVFAVVIVLHHGKIFPSNSGTKYFVAGYIGVEFFFIVSGYLMAKSEDKMPKTTSIGIDTYKFLKQKFSKLLLPIYISWVVAFVIGHINAEHSIGILIKDFVQSIPELLLITQSGISWKVYSSALWYISSMLFALMISFPLLRKYKDSYFYIIAPIVFLIIMGRFFQKYGCLDKPFGWDTIIVSGTERAIADIIAGSICFKVSQYLSRINFTKLMRSIFTLVEWCIYIAIVIFCVNHTSSKWDFIIVLMLMVSATITFSKVSFDEYIFNRQVFEWLGEYSFALYLGHPAWRNFYKNLYPDNWDYFDYMIAYVLLSAITALIIMYSSKGLKSLWNKHQPKIKQLFIKAS